MAELRTSLRSKENELAVLGREKAEEAARLAAFESSQQLSQRSEAQASWQSLFEMLGQ